MQTHTYAWMHGCIHAQEPWAHAGHRPPVLHATHAPVQSVLSARIPNPGGGRTETMSSSH